MSRRDAIVIGGSTGSGAVLQQILGALPADLPAAVFVATHVPARSGGHLTEVLARASSLPVSRAIDGQPVEAGTVYVARAGAGPRPCRRKP